MPGAQGQNIDQSSRLAPGWLWLGLALIVFGLRALLFGVALITPSIAVLLGMSSDTMFGPVPNTHIAVEDPVLLVAGVVFLLLALRAWSQGGRRS